MGGTLCQERRGKGVACVLPPPALVLHFLLQCLCLNSHHRLTKLFASQSHSLTPPSLHQPQQTNTWQVAFQCCVLAQLQGRRWRPFRLTNQGLALVS